MRNKRIPWVRTTLIAAGALVLIMAAVGWLTPILEPAARGLLTIAAPVRAAALSARAEAEKISGQQPACDPAAAGREEALKIENAKLRAAVAENEAMKQALGFKPAPEETLVAARVIYESGDEWSRLFVIDRGADDGLAPDQPVIVGDGVIIGKIFRAGKLTSTVLPLADSRSRLAVTVQNSKETMGALEGDRGLSMSMTLVPQTEDLSPGDAVVTSGIERGIRRGLIVGVIDKVTKSTQDPFQSASVSPLGQTAHPLVVQVIKTRPADSE